MPVMSRCLYGTQILHTGYARFTGMQDLRSTIQTVVKIQTFSVTIFFLVAKIYNNGQILRSCQF